MNETVGTATASPSLLELQSRVRAAQGSDCTLDAAICLHLDAMQPHPWKERFPKAADVPAPVTASIDAALGLVERVLPNHPPAIGFLAFGTHVREPWCTIWKDGVPQFSETGATAPLAILNTLLSALIAQSKAEGRSSPQSDTGE